MRSTLKTLAVSLSIALAAAVNLSTVSRAETTAADLSPLPTQAEESSTDLAGGVMDAPEAAEDMAETETTEASAAAESTGSTIVDIAAGDENFSTLVEAVTAADLVETLSGEGPYTVFAPTNDAFEALPDGVLEALMLPENKALLTKILTYHVVSGSVAADDLVAGAVPTVEGSDIMVSLGDKVTVNNATVIMADVEASNGVIHVIDTVIIPPDLMSTSSAN